MGGSCLHAMKLPVCRQFSVPIILFPTQIETLVNTLRGRSFVVP